MQDNSSMMHGKHHAFVKAITCGKQLVETPLVEALYGVSSSNQLLRIVQLQRFKGQVRHPDAIVPRR